MSPRKGPSFADLRRRWLTPACLLPCYPPAVLALFFLVRRFLALWTGAKEQSPSDLEYHDGRGSRWGQVGACSVFLGCLILHTCRQGHTTRARLSPGQIALAHDTTHSCTLWHSDEEFMKLESMFDLVRLRHRSCHPSHEVLWWCWFRVSFCLEIYKRLWFLVSLCLELYKRPFSTLLSTISRGTSFASSLGFRPKP